MSPSARASAGPGGASAIAPATHRLALGWRHGCVIVDGGAVRCWGLDNAGQLGAGDTRSRDVPVAVRGLTGARSLALGRTESCAVRDDATLWCWGDDGVGQLGDGSTGFHTTPVRALLDDVVDVGLGDSHGCAVRGDGTVRCWGYADSGQLGDGTRTNRLAPVLVAPIRDAVQIAVGGRFSCARDTHGAVFCWGANANGQLGDGSTTSSATPVRVANVDDAAELVAFGESACVRRQSGEVVCWGASELGGERDRLVPTRVSGDLRPVEIALGDRLICARSGDARVSCWGSTTASFAPSLPAKPARYPELDGATEIAAGGGHACARLAHGDVACFGANEDGQLGDGSVSRARPERVPGVARAVELTASGPRTCARLEGGRVACWGGLWLDDGGMSSPSPTTVALSSWQGLQHIGIGEDGLCGLTASGQVECLGDNTRHFVADDASRAHAKPVLVAGVAGATSLAVGAAHACAIERGGSVACWGDDSFGQLGTAPTKGGGSSKARVVAGVSGAKAIASGHSATCAIVARGGVRCWGGGLFSGGLDAVSVPQPAPLDVTGLRDATSIAMGFQTACAVANGEVSCWETPATGPVRGLMPGAPTPPLAVKIAGASSATQVTTSGQHTCARTSNGAVWCWGSGESGQLGDGTTDDHAAPVAVAGITNALEVVAGSSHTCARTSDGAVWCWGRATEGQLGAGRRDFAERPRRVALP